METPIGHEGYTPNETALAEFNAIHIRKAFRLYANKFCDWYVIYMPMHGIHQSFCYGGEANRLIKIALRKSLRAAERNK